MNRRWFVFVFFFSTWSSTFMGVSWCFYPNRPNIQKTNHPIWNVDLADDFGWFSGFMIHHNSSGFFVDFLLIVHGFSIMLRGCGFFINGCVILVHHPGGFSSSMVIGMSILHISSSSIHHQWWFLHGFSSSMNNSVIVPVVVPMSISQPRGLSASSSWCATLWWCCAHCSQEPQPRRQRQRWLRWLLRLAFGCIWMIYNDL